MITKKCDSLQWNEGYTTLWRDPFGTVRSVVILFGVAHFVASPFWSEFDENNFFLLLYVSIFLIYKKISVFTFFQK